MDQLTNVVTYLAGLSVATERITEAIKRLPYLSWLFSQTKPDPKWEDVRVILVHALAVLVGGVLCWQTQGALTNVLPQSIHTGFWECVFLGVLASGGSGFWNSALDTLREVKKQKENLRRASEATVK